MRTQRPRIFSADFETTSYEGQTFTEVWAAAIVELGTEDVTIVNSIDDLFKLICSFDFNSIIYFHNIKFDGEFWLHYLLTYTKFKQCFNQPDKSVAVGEFTERKFMKSGEFRYSISSKGQWYSITIKNGKYFIELRDSLKLLPTSVKRIGESFGTKHKKTSIEYTGYRKAGGIITEQEKEYIANDVLVVKEALEIMYSQGHTGLTIGACCLDEYKNKSCPFLDFDKSLPNLYELPEQESRQQFKDTFGSDNYGEYIRKSYRGGWCYVVDEKKGKPFKKGTTADVNSLYPSMMHSQSGNRFPIGTPTFWIGNYIPDEAKDGEHYYFVRIKTEFKIKPKHLPCIQIKNSPYYPPNQWLRTSEIISRIDGSYHSKRKTIEGEIIPTQVELTLTMTDFQLIKDHYFLKNLEILDGCYFRSAIGIFDEYIDKYKEIKMNSKGAVREIAKLFLNNLYGKMATSTDSSFKVAFLKEDGSLGYFTVIENKKKPGYIPIGSAITSYARNFTIRAAQKNYHGIRNHGFIYADTDSIHCDLPPDKLVGIKVHNSEFCCWKLESCWDEAVFIRQKTYAEHITHENLEPVEGKPYWEVKCAGMPDTCKQLFILSFEKWVSKAIEKGIQIKIRNQFLTPEETEFLSETRTIEDFKVGLRVPGKLMPKHINGGIVLKSDYYTMKRSVFFV